MIGLRPPTLPVALFAALVALLGLSAPALATFPGTNGPILFARGPGPMSPVCSDDIWSMQPDGSGQMQITNSPECESGPAVSPNGNLIAFARGNGPMRTSPYWSGNVFGPARVFVGAQQISFDDDEAVGWPDWAPDGKSVVYTDHSFCCGGTRAVNWPPPGPMEGYYPSPYGNEPAFSPHGDKVALTYRNVDSPAEWFDLISHDLAAGSGTLLTTGTANEYAANWSPDGSKIAFARAERTGTNPDGSYIHGPADIYVMDAAGSNVQQLTSGAHNDDFPAWSPDGTKIAFVRCCFIDGTTELFTVEPDGTDVTRLTDDATSEWDPNWKRATSGDPPGYPRVKGAANLTVPLVPAYAECQAPNREHGPAFAFPSCAPPDRLSELLTVGTPDANAQPAKSIGSVTLTSLAGDPNTRPTGPFQAGDEADVKIDARLTDVRRADDLSDYAPSEILAIVLTMRRTDKSPYAPAGPPISATGEDFTLRVSLPCAPTSDPSEGARCTRISTLDALAPGFIKEGHRTTWEVREVRIDDAGLDNDFETPEDDRTFAVSGLFVP